MSEFDQIGGSMGPDIYLTHEHMEKMGIKPHEQGAHLHLEVRGHVSGSGTHEDEHGKPHHHMTIRVHHIKVSKAKKGAGAKLYAESDKSGEGET